MKKALLVGFLVLTSIGLIAGAQNSYVLKIKVQIANVRTEPDLNAQVIGQVKLGELLEASNKVGSFFEISITDKNGKAVPGFIHSSVVDIIKGEEQPPQPQQKRPAVQQPQAAVEQPQRTEPVSYVSQEPKRFILRAGLAMTNVSLSEEIPAGYTKSSATGFGASIGYEFGGPNFCIEINAVYAPGGFSISGTNQGTPVKVSVSGSGIGASVIAKIKFMPGSTPYVLVGGDIGYLLSQKTTITAGGQTSENTSLEEVNRIAYGVEFGAGFEFNMQGVGLLVEAKYALGLSNQIKNPTADEYVKPTGFTIGLGVKL